MSLRPKTMVINQQGTPIYNSSNGCAKASTVTLTYSKRTKAYGGIRTLARHLPTEINAFSGQ